MEQNQKHINTIPEDKARYYPPEVSLREARQPRGNLGEGAKNSSGQGDNGTAPASRSGTFSFIGRDCFVIPTLSGLLAMTCPLGVFARGSPASKSFPRRRVGSETPVVSVTMARYEPYINE